MKLKSLIKKIEAKYPTNLAYSWDNVGLLVGEYEKEVKKERKIYLNKKGQEIKKWTE